MEDTKPILIQKSKDDSNLTLKQIKEYKLINNEKEYLIQLGKTSIKENIGFKIKEKSSDQKIIYDKYLSLEELQKISKSFRVFDNIDEALTSIEDIFQENNANIKSENDNLYINLQINKVGKGKEIVEIKLEKRAFSLKEMNAKLENDIKNLKIEIEEIKNDNKYLKEEIKYLKENNLNEKNEINYLKKEIELLKKEIEILKNKNNIKIKIFIINFFIN
jgi:predicted RNase H-like nuclease (RuvC/YqgF family)